MAEVVSPYHPVSPSLDNVVGNDEIREGAPNITIQSYDTPENPSRRVKDRRDEKARSTVISQGKRNRPRFIVTNYLLATH